MKLMIAMYVTALVAGVLSTSAKGEEKFDKNIVFGVDNRQDVVGTTTVTMKIGRLQTEYGHCTATLVSKNLAITAAHCMVDSSGNLVAAQFYPNMINGRSTSSANVIRTWLGTNNPQGEREKDWAILQLDRDLGYLYGWMDVVYAEPSTISVIGYSGDKHDGQTMTAALGCQVGQRFSNGLFTHNCDSTAGSSGSAVIQLAGSGDSLRGQIVGIHVAASKGSDYAYESEFGDRFNAAVSSRNFGETLRAAYAQVN